VTELSTFAGIAARIFANETSREFMTEIEVQTAGGEIVKIHPSLNILPLMNKDEMTGLVKSIKRNGLRMPVIVDASGVLVDGRCRLMACELAGIQPRFETLPEGADPLDWICGTNILRQSYGTQQIAMARALLGQEGEAGDTSLAQACIVARHSKALARRVMDHLTLGEALEQVKRDENAASVTKAKAVQLRRLAPALADRVSDGELSLDDALAQSEALADLAGRIREEQAGIRNAFKRGIEHAMAAGDLLIEAKEQLVHGQWGPWLEDNCEMSARTARRYMYLASNRDAIEAKMATVANLNLTVRGAVKLLAAPVDEDDTPGGEQERERAVIAEALPLILHQIITDESERADFESRVKRYLREQAKARNRHHRPIEE